MIFLNFILFIFFVTGCPSCNSGACDRSTGTCSCQAGYWGLDCEQSNDLICYTYSKHTYINIREKKVALAFEVS